MNNTEQTTEQVEVQSNDTATVIELTLEQLGEVGGGVAYVLI